MRRLDEPVEEEVRGQGVGGGGGADAGAAQRPLGETEGHEALDPSGQLPVVRDEGRQHSAHELAHSRATGVVQHRLQSQLRRGPLQGAPAGEGHLLGRSTRPPVGGLKTSLQGRCPGTHRLQAGRQPLQAPGGREMGRQRQQCGFAQPSKERRHQQGEVGQVHQAVTELGAERVEEASDLGKAHHGVLTNGGHRAVRRGADHSEEDRLLHQAPLEMAQGAGPRVRGEVSRLMPHKLVGEAVGADHNAVDEQLREDLVKVPEQGRADHTAEAAAEHPMQPSPCLEQCQDGRHLPQRGPPPRRCLQAQSQDLGEAPQSARPAPQRQGADRVRRIQAQTLLLVGADVGRAFPPWRCLAEVGRLGRRRQRPSPGHCRRGRLVPMLKEGRQIHGRIRRRLTAAPRGLFLKLGL
mmetsp:Transcript_107128/g.341934  ORF Transcript_107128/g.341934 Transcript_107128/m.341934 type:complete len:408 (+) Transcript_107128:1451-2674(+)